MNTKKLLSYSLLTIALSVSFTGHGMQQKNQIDEKDIKTFIKSAKAGEMAKVKELLNKDSRLANAHKDNKEYGKAALHYTAKKGMVEMTALLLYYGGDPEIKAMTGKGALITPFYRAKKAKVNQAEILDLLNRAKDAQGDTDRMEEFKNYVKDRYLDKKAIETEEFEEESESPILNKFIKAAEKNNIKKIDQMIKDKELDINMQDEKSGKTPLIESVRRNKDDIVAFLVNQPDIKIDLAPKTTKKTALMRAVVYGNGKIVSTLIAAGADVTLKDYKNKTAADIAQIQIDTLPEPDNAKFKAVLKLLQEAK